MTPRMLVNGLVSEQLPALVAMRTGLPLLDLRQVK